MYIGGNLWPTIILVILIAASAYFSASETALMSLSKIRIRHMVEEQVKGAEEIQKLIQNPNRLLGTVLVGNTVINIGASALATSLAINTFGARGALISTGVMTVVVLIFAEITPKSLAANNSEAFSLKVIKTMTMCVVILKPIVNIFTYITSIILNIFGVKVNKDRPFITEEELRTIVDVSEEQGVLEVEEKNMIHNVFEFGDLLVRDVMVQRMDIVGVDISSTIQDIIEVMKEERFSRLAVYNENIDNIVGILNVKDLLFFDYGKEEFSMEKFMREPYYTFEYKNLAKLLSEMKKNRTHMVIVLDEYGGTAGIVTTEDLIEEIVGEIQDEYDKQEEDIFVVKEDEYLVAGATRIEDVNDMIGTNIESEEFDSIGGFVIGLLGRLPEEHENIENNGIKYTIESIERNRIKKIRIIT
jgi:putative hemolysin